MKVLEKSLGLCSTCLRTTAMKYVERNGNVFIEKNCCEHESFYVASIENYKKIKQDKLVKRNDLKVGDTIEEVIEKSHRNLAVMPIYITSKCNLNCSICFLKYTIPQPDMSLEEIKEKVKKNKGIFINLIGGEVTMRKDLPEIIRVIKKEGKIVCLNTNGLKLINKKYLRELKRAGLDEVCLSFDGFSDDIYVKFRGKKLLGKKLKILKKLKEEEISTHLLVVIDETNINQIKNIIKFAALNSCFIETVLFLSLYEIPNKRDIASKIYEEVNKIVGIGFEYYTEWKKVYANCYNLFNSSSNFSDVNYDMFIFKASNPSGKILPILSLEELKDVNNVFENLSVRNILKNLRPFFKIFKLGLYHLFHRFSPVSRHFWFRKERLIKIWFNSISSPANVDFGRCLSVPDGVKTYCDGGKLIDGKRRKWPPFIMAG